MDRELLIEIGTEEIPASWLPALTAGIGTTLEAQLTEARLLADAPVETFSTPRRLTARVAKIADHQTDLEELVSGPPASVAFGPDGRLTPAGAGFAKKQGVDVSALERIETPKGIYLGVRRHTRGRAAVDVLPQVMTGVLRGLSFPKAMRWDAVLDDGRGDLPFGRPIRWLLFLYGGRVVPFSIGRSPAARGAFVQDVHAGGSTYGHRFHATSGRPGYAVKVKHFDDYRKRLAEHFVVLERAERRDRIVRELDVEARRRGGRVATALVGHTVLEEVPDLVEYPVVISGSFGEEFLGLPEAVLTTTMIHHQHFFPVTGDHGALLPVFLAVLNMQPERVDAIARNMERVLTARLRDARFFFDADRAQPLGTHGERLSTLLFHKALGTYKDKAERIERLARWICAEVFGRDDLAGAAAQAGRLCKADLATAMVRELTELQGVMGGIYAREEGRPEEVWRAIAHHYLPVGVEALAPPTREQLGPAAVTWAAVSLADKLDSVVGMFAAGERPTGSRDPYGLRRAAQGVARILVDLPELTGLDCGITLGHVVAHARGTFAAEDEADFQRSLWAFMGDRVRSVMEQRGYDIRNIRAVTGGDAAALSPLVVRRKLEDLPPFVQSPEFRQLAELFKRVRNIAKNLPFDEFVAAEAAGEPLSLVEPAELALQREIAARRPAIDAVVASGKGFGLAFAEAAGFGPAVAAFFDDVMVMADDPQLRRSRLRLMNRLEQLVLQLGDISEIVSEADIQEQTS